MNVSQYYGYIYKITNLQNRKVYIGLSTQIDNKKYFCGGIYIKQAIKKYGKKFFKREILGFCNSKEELDLCEQECINFFNSSDKLYGYNLTNGGGCFGKFRTFSESTKQKMSENHANVKGENNPRFIKIYESDKKQIIDLYTNGMNCKEIAEIVKINKRKVSKILKENNIIVNSQGLKGGKRINGKTCN